jgi:hypothetical protein
LRTPFCHRNEVRSPIDIAPSGTGWLDHRHAGPQRPIFDDFKPFRVRYFLDQCGLAEPARGWKETAMNWRRRLLRIWLVLSLCWIAGVGLYAWKQEPWTLSSFREFVFEDDPGSARDQQNESADEIINRLDAETAKQYALLLIVPPLATLAFGLLTAWVLTSFERKGAR